ncbi:unnamed protein product, partial [Commensalibacter communis]|uniref:hypothetical protein n=2 Tax=Commensalibacter communis TaxID=2972786 RepID=UPI0022FFB9FE
RLNITIPKGQKGDKGDQGESYTNDGTVDLNVKSITSDNEQIKSDGKGNLVVNNLETTGVISPATFDTTIGTYGFPDGSIVVNQNGFLYILDRKFGEWRVVLTNRTKDNYTDHSRAEEGIIAWDDKTKQPCWWDGNQWIETCVNNGTADLNVKSINESALVGASGQTLENLLDNSIKVVSVSDATSDNFIEKVKNNKISDVKMVGELLSDNKVIDIANNNDIAEGNIIKISVDSVPTANADEFNKYGIQIRLYVPMVNGDTSMSDGSTAEKMRQLVVTLYYGDILFLKHIGSSSMFGITFPIYHANISRGDQILTDLSQYVVNNGTVDLNVKSINSDNGLIKSDGNGNLTFVNGGYKTSFSSTDGIKLSKEVTDNSYEPYLSDSGAFILSNDGPVMSRTYDVVVGPYKKETVSASISFKDNGYVTLDSPKTVVKGDLNVQDGDIKIENYGNYLTTEKLTGQYKRTYKSGNYTLTQNVGFVNFNRFRVYGSYDGIKNNYTDENPYMGTDIFFYPTNDQTNSNGFAMALKIGGYIDAKGDEKTVALLGSDKLIGHDNLNFNGANTLDPTDPWYISSRLFRFLPKKLSEIKITTSEKMITNAYMSGTVGLSTNYFTKSDDDTKQDGFITPVIWDVDTDDVTKGRTLGVPYIPADKKITLPDTANIEVGTQSFDTNSKKPCWWDGSKWVNVIIDGQRAENLVATSAKIYRLEFIDSWNTYINFPNMWGATYGARTKNNGITQRYFEKTRTAAERKQIETDIANEISDPTRKQTALDNIANKQYTDSKSAGLFPNYNVFQMYNRNTFVNLNNYYFDGPLVSTGAVNLGKISDLTSDSIIQDGAVALNSSKLPSVYNATNKSWSNIPVKQKYIGDIANDSSEIIVDTFKVKLIAGATGGISLATTSGTIKVSGFHECLYAATGNGNQLVDATLTASFVSIPDLGITVDHEHRKMWFWNTTTPDDNLYFVELFKRGSKVIMQVWKE